MWRGNSIWTVIVEAPNRATVCGELAAYEERSAIGTPQLFASEAPGKANIIELGVVLTITGLGTTALRAVADHDSVDRVFTVGTLFELITKFGREFRPSSARAFVTAAISSPVGSA